MTSQRSGVRRGVARVLAVCLLAAGLVGTVPAAAETPTGDGPVVVPVQTTGPADRRFNLVFLGDGYTAAEMPAFRADLERHLNTLWSIEPFASYRSYVNVWAVESPSAESGVDCDPGLDAPARDTVLDMGFWGGCNPGSVQRLLTVDGRKAAALADLVPGTKGANRQIVALAHSSTYGGAGGGYATASGGNALSSLITPHEIGHSLGGLQDEYDYYGRGVPGEAYSGPEPSSAHHTLLTERQMLDGRAKWWRWLGEESEAGGLIGRHEGGMYSTKGVWRPSRHSLMKTLGYAFDQVEREVMVRAISAKVDLVQDHTPDTAPVGADRTVWVDTLHPVGGALSVTWRLDGRTLPTGGARSVDLRRLRLAPGPHTLTATVTDPTPFVRDPAVRSSPALTRTVSWTVDPSLTTAPDGTAAAFTGHTPTGSPVGGRTVVHADTTHPVGRTPVVRWRLDGRPVATGANDRDLDLRSLRMAPGTHTLTARLAGTAETLTWAVDARPATAAYELSEPLRTVRRPGLPVEYVYDGPFTMRLTARDDREGAVVSQFRVDGDGWYTYYGWPTDADAPFRFTPGGTVIDDLVYGKLGRSRAVPWDDATPDYGRHTVEYRTIDAAGNVSAARSFLVTLNPPGR
ncbi:MULTISPECIES: M64 family metallopeptidase [unclassified Streptomyces]|uniref:M64 family metallopeptidase n=1 Tax=unclassified Streptomyces TaxID=2593676 RepID=UPI0006FD77EC|nr:MULTISPECIES: M64 family metallopeptidase [unclassified Streptomyces]KQX50921.1 peptidase [Streptomyces sp. Root1304]KRA85087.1 peptidase [Streptomyces sp. Root66D1]